MEKVNFFKDFFLGVSLISTIIDIEELNKLVKEIKKIKNKKGRIFFLGVGGSAGNCSHAVNDFRKICGIESYTPLDNVSELTARINDEGWDSSLSNWLKVSNLNSKDAIFIFSVGGGDKKKKY
jgi:D-sedoheptulose 7-phosphate isomerase